VVNGQNLSIFGVLCAAMDRCGFCKLWRFVYKVAAAYHRKNDYV